MTLCKNQHPKTEMSELLSKITHKITPVQREYKSSVERERRNLVNLFHSYFFLPYIATFENKLLNKVYA